MAVRTVPEGPLEILKSKEEFAHLIERAATTLVVDEYADAYVASLFSAKTADPMVRYEQPKTCLSQFRTPGSNWRARSRLA